MWMNSGMAEVRATTRDERSASLVIFNPDQRAAADGGGAYSRQRHRQGYLDGRSRPTLAVILSPPVWVI